MDNYHITRTENGWALKKEGHGARVENGNHEG
ncbi:hypothetical protein QF039_002628 [Pseudomonas sp. W2I6]|nr:hypothetical protein [Pseudomonas sp. W2I6]